MAPWPGELTSRRRWRLRLWRRWRLRLWRRRERGSRRPGDLAIEVEVRGRLSGDEPRAAVEGQVLDRPFHEDDDAALVLDEIHDVDERPDEPRRQPRQVDPEHVRDRGGPSDHGHGSLVEVLERRKRLLAKQPPRDHLSRIRSLLHRDLGHAL